MSSLASMDRLSRQFKQTYHRGEIEFVTLKNSLQTKIQDWTASCGILSTCKEELVPMLLKLFSKIERGNSPKFILQCHHHPDIKIRPRYYKKLQANIFYECECKNP